MEIDSQLNDDDPIDDIKPTFIPPIPPPKCKPWAHPEWRGGIDGYWVAVDDREWGAVEIEIKESQKDLEENDD